MHSFDTLNYLQNGNTRQQLAYQMLVEHNVFEHLAAYDPILVGTIPINIDIETSDLDIACCWENKTQFMYELGHFFGHNQEFRLIETCINGEETVIAHFKTTHFKIEIFGQNIPTKRQNSYRHMIIEQRILLERSEEFRQQIINLKQQGMKTEPAFGFLLGIKNDPYQALLDFEM